VGHFVGEVGVEVDQRLPAVAVRRSRPGRRRAVGASPERRLLKTTTTLSSGQRIDTRLDPDVYRVSVGVRF
jgi:hypothetical protein